MSKKETATSSVVVTGTLFKFKAICVLYDLGAAHSSISIRSTMQFNLEDRRTETNYRFKLSNDCVIECPISYKLVLITIGGTAFPVDLIRFNLSYFDISLGMNCLHTLTMRILRLF